MSAGRPLTGGVSGYPHRAARLPYASSNLYVLTVPDDMGNLYDYPAGALNEIRRNMSKDLDAYIEGPAKVALFLYDKPDAGRREFQRRACEYQHRDGREKPAN